MARSKSCGLPLRVDFFTQQGMIHRVDLTLNPEPHLSWSVSGANATPKLEEQIDGWMELYSCRKQPNIALPISLDQIPHYTSKVLFNLANVPFGHVLTYGELADRNGNKAAARAIGNACARNPCLLIIPCHRVLTSGHRLGGFSGGTEIKQILLNFEKSSL